jgi:hypothetical protein
MDLKVVDRSIRPRDGRIHETIHKFDMFRLDTCLDGMGGFQNSRMYDVPT